MIRFFVLSMSLNQNHNMKYLLITIFSISLFACSNYGKKLSKDYLEVYYKDGVTKEEAQRALDFLYPLWKTEGEGTNTKSIQLTKPNDTIHFTMVVDEAKLKDVGDENFNTMGNLFSDSVFKGAPVNMVLSNESFEQIKKLTYKKISYGNNFGDKATAGNVEVYYKDGVEKNQAQLLANFIQKENEPMSTISFQAFVSNGVTTVRMASDADKAKELGDAPFQTMAMVMSDSVFNHAPVTLELTDNAFNPFKSFTSTTNHSKQ